MILLRKRGYEQFNLQGSSNSIKYCFKRTHLNALLFQQREIFIQSINLSSILDLTDALALSTFPEKHFLEKVEMSKFAKNTIKAPKTLFWDYTLLHSCMSLR